jgi:pSer/pThr/pTyr-binding forkhead associated (FHA) protein
MGRYLMLTDKVNYLMLPQRKTRDAKLAAVEPQSRLSTGFPTLKLTRDGIVLQELTFDTQQILIGRTDDNDLSIPGSYVSRHHILLFRHGDSTILVDLNSTNGTFVNSKRVYNHKLIHGDKISIDTHSMFVEYRISFSDPAMSARNKSKEIDPEDVVIAKALANFGNVLAKGDTYLLPTLSEDVPTVVGFVDDR